MVDPLNHFSFQTVFHDWCNKGRGLCYPVCGGDLYKRTLAANWNRSPCGAMGRRIDPSLGGPIELFLVPASAPRLV